MDIWPAAMEAGRDQSNLRQSLMLSGRSHDAVQVQDVFSRSMLTSDLVSNSFLYRYRPSNVNELHSKSEV